VRITWPHHPLYLQSVPLVELWEGSGHRRFVIELPDGSHTRIPASWADNGDGPPPDVDQSGAPVLSLAAVRDLVVVLGQLVERRPAHK
jgi:hypothetical protein